jgi:sulfide:quinone oxidoreductase
MARIVVLGAGLGGMPAAFELRKHLDRRHGVTVINEADRFKFVPSNPWVAVGWRKPEKVTVDLSRALARKGIDLVVASAARVSPADCTVTLGNGTVIPYDYLVIATGPKLAFEEIPGLGPQGFTQSVCTLEHALKAYEAYQKFLATPGPVVIGAAQGASCFGPAYELAMIVDADLRRRRLRSSVPMTLVTSEPYIGHLGLGGVGDSKGMLESALRQRDIRWIVNAKIGEVKDGEMAVSTVGSDGVAAAAQSVAFRWAMIIPAFRGVDAVAAATEICNPRGFVAVDRRQRNAKYPNVYSAGVCVAIAPPEATPVPTGVPKTGYMIESMVSTAAANIKAELDKIEPSATSTWNAVCLADMGDSGMAFVAAPQMPPRNITWAREGRWVHIAKVAFEKYFLRKMRTGNSEPFFEKWVLKRLGVTRVSQ